MIDYEFLNQTQSGLDLIEELSIGKNSILITSRFEEEKIQERCISLGVKIIPKTMAGFIPLEIQNPKIKYDWLLIDNDPLVHMTWSMAAKDNLLQFKGYANHIDFLKDALEIDTATPIYIDSNLSKEIKGEEVAKEIYKLGFNIIYLVTGCDPDSFKDVSHIKAVLGKLPPI